MEQAPAGTALLAHHLAKCTTFADHQQLLAAEGHTPIQCANIPTRFTGTQAMTKSKQVLLLPVCQRGNTAGQAPQQQTLIVVPRNSGSTTPLINMTAPELVANNLHQSACIHMSQVM
jgi:hypothetical protein